MKQIYLMAAVAALGIVACQSPEKPKSVTEEAKTEKPSVETVKIGSQVFMLKNLDVDHYRNGDPIPEARTKEEWAKYAKDSAGAWCYYNFEADKGKIYGKLYNGFAISDKRMLAPEGWHIPSTDEYMQLSKFIGGSKNGAVKLKAKAGWFRNGNNTTGFTALAAGFYAGDFNKLDSATYFWTSNVTDNGYHDHMDIDWLDDDFKGWYDHDSWGLSVRCTQDAAATK